MELRTFEATGGWPALRPRLAETLPEPTIAELDETVEFAVSWHGDQVRPAGEPYVEHLLEALCVLVDAIGVTDLDVLRAAILHDVVEDTDCPLDEVRSRFGERVAELVDWVTKSDPADGQTPEQARSAYLTRLRSAPADALLVKLADRVSNVQRLNTHPRPAKQRSYYQETIASIVPLARTHPWFRDWYATWRNTFAHLAS